MIGGRFTSAPFSYEPTRTRLSRWASALKIETRYPTRRVGLWFYPEASIPSAAFGSHGYYRHLHGIINAISQTENASPTLRVGYRVYGFVLRHLFQPPRPACPYINDVCMVSRILFLRPKTLRPPLRVGHRVSRILFLRPITLRPPLRVGHRVRYHKS
jgi:hypothetical protein